MKKLVSTFLAGVIALTMAVPAFAADAAANNAPFTDVKTDTEQGQAIIKMYEKGYLAGYEDGTFRPDGYVTRAELVRIINQVFGFGINDKLNTVDFTDNSNNQVWYYEDVRIAQQMGYISGFGDNSFRPKDNFTRQQACVVLSLLTNAPEAEQEAEISDTVAPWAVKYVNSAVSAGLFQLEENNTFRAVENITRGELCVALAGFVKDTAEVTTQVSQATTDAESDDDSTTTTKKSVVISGGGGSNSNKKTTTTTETTTETTTVDSKTTTKATTSTTTTVTTAATTTTEATTELTTASVQVDADLLTSLKRTVRNINRYVIPNCSTDAVKEVAGDIADAMSAFAADSSYDVQSAANEAMDKYRALSSAEKEEFKKLIIGYCAMSDLVKLRDTFFPGLTY